MSSLKFCLRRACSSRAACGMVICFAQFANIFSSQAGALLVREHFFNPGRSTPTRMPIMQYGGSAESPLGIMSGIYLMERSKAQRPVSRSWYAWRLTVQLITGLAASPTLKQ
eukprot:gnl/MRDRNA2_/MRDRNA2_86721_c6_seq14.p1 gnl/MRDRNA2_/MRDRNA2_86721_c6~~gnl/MRDRNA2_/MRDRNA2_86721_c6_seq14.p1  ORF type:complete len:112 (+),score=11.31 gnl/MRDRNA2_/MRDRNA2_86721_c6_seq14:156-491(+)